MAFWLEAVGSSLTLTDASLLITLEERTLNPDSPEVEPIEVSVQTVTEGCGFLNVLVGDINGQNNVGNTSCNPFPAVALP